MVGVVEGMVWLMFWLVVWVKVWLILWLWLQPPPCGPGQAEPVQGCRWWGWWHAGWKVVAVGMATGCRGGCVLVVMKAVMLARVSGYGAGECECVVGESEC